MTKATDALLDLIETRAKQSRTVRALLGDGTGTVIVAGTDNYVWVRPYGRNMPVRAYGPAFVSAPHDLPVRVHIIHTGARVLYRVGSVDDIMYMGTSLPAGWTDVPAHASQHMITQGGFDPVYIDQDQFLPLLVFATNPPSMSVYISTATWWSGTALKYWPGGETVDLSSYIPAAGFARHLLVYIDDNTQQPGFVAGPTFVDEEPLFKDPRLETIPSPAGSVPVGIVRLRSSKSSITQDSVYSLRPILAPVGTASLLTEVVMMAAKDDGVYKSAGITWTQLSPSDTFLTQVEFVAAIGATEWLVFREQTAASADDPLVYRTDDGGVSWEQAQDGMSYTQGTDIWRVCAMWQQVDDPAVVTIAIANTTTDSVPQVFLTRNGGKSWFEIDNTGLPTTNLSGNEFPHSIALKASTVSTFTACMAMLDAGLYFKEPGQAWADRTPTGANAVYAVGNDFNGAGSWWATELYKAWHTTTSWGGSSVHYLYNNDTPSQHTRHIYQHPLDGYHVVVGANAGVQITVNGSDFVQYTAGKIGVVGSVLVPWIGRVGAMFVTNTDGDLFVSVDGGKALFEQINIADVNSFAAISTQASVGTGTIAEMSLIDLWAKV